MAGTPSVPGGTGGGAPMNSGTPTPSSGGPAWKNQAKNAGVDQDGKLSGQAKKQLSGAKQQANTVKHAAGVGTKDAARKETPREHRDNQGSQQYHDDIRQQEINQKAKGKQVESVGKVGKEAGKQVGGAYGAIIGGAGAAVEEGGKMMNEGAHYRAEKEHAFGDAVTGDIKDYQAAEERREKAEKEHRDFQKNAPKQFVTNVAKGAIDGATKGESESITTPAADIINGEGSTGQNAAKLAAGGAGMSSESGSGNDEPEIGAGGDSDKEGLAGELTGDSGDSKDGDKKDEDKKGAKDELIGGDTNPEKERKEKEKNQDKYITDNDRKDPTGDMMPKGKKEKKKGPLEKAKAALKAAALAFKLFMMTQILMLAMKVAALVAQLFSFLANAIAAIIQVATAIATAIGVAVATVVMGGLALIVGVAVAVAAVVVGGSEDPGEYTGLPCVEQEDWDALDLEYLDTGDADEAKMISAKIVYGVLRQLGFDNNNIAGILTNFEAESGIDSTKLENNANADSWEGGSWPYSDVYEHADEEGNPQWHAEYGVMLDSPAGEDTTMSENRYLYSKSLYEAISKNADIGSASSRFAVSYGFNGGSSGCPTYAQQFVNVYGVAFNKPPYIEEDYGFEDIRNTISGKVVTSVNTSNVGTGGVNTFDISGSVDIYDSNGQKYTDTQDLSSDIAFNMGPEVGTASMESIWGSDHPAHLDGQSYKSDWMYCAGGLYIRSFDNYSVAERFDSDRVDYGYDTEVTGPDGVGDSTDDGTDEPRSDVTYTYADGTTVTVRAEDWDGFLADNLIWGYCDEHQCSGIHQFKANAPSTYWNPTWSYWCVESWHAQWTNTSDYYIETIDGLEQVDVEESAYHSCRHAVYTDGSAVEKGGYVREGSYDRYIVTGYTGSRNVSSGSYNVDYGNDAVDLEHLKDYNALTVGNVTQLGPHRVHIPHLSQFRLWATDDQSVYEYWAGLGDSPAASGAINYRGVGLGQLTNGRFCGSQGQDLHSELSTSGYRGATTADSSQQAMRNCHTEADGSIRQLSWINPAVKNAGLYNYAKSRGKPWYDIEIQLQYYLDEEEGDVKAEWMIDWSVGREPDATDAAKIFLAVWEMSKSNQTEGALEAAETLPSAMVESHSANAPYWIDQCASWLASRDYSRSMSESIVQAAKATSDRGTDRAEEVGYCASPSHGNTDIAHAAALIAWDNHDDAKNTPGTQVFVCVRNNVFEVSENGYHTQFGTWPNPRHTYQSCDITAATSVRWGGGDDDYPGYSCKVQLQYLKSHQDKWMQVTYDSIQPGDIMIYSEGNSGHTRVYVGKEVIEEVWPELKGQGYVIVEGSLDEHSPWMSKADPGYDSTFMVFRNIQPEADSKWKDINICDGASMHTAGTAHSPTG